MGSKSIVEIPVAGMDCADCAAHVHDALAALPGVEGVEVLLGAEKAILRADTSQVTMPAIRAAVEAAGYRVPEQTENAGAGTEIPAPETTLTRKAFALFGLVIGAVLFLVVAVEWLGVLDGLVASIPWWVGLAAVLTGGYPIFRNVLKAALQRRVISHTLMTLGVIAAILVGEWITAAVVVFFMRMGDYAESMTTGRARKAVKDLTAMSPRTARVEVNGQEETHPVEAVRQGDTIIVRPGEVIPVDGEVTGGRATVNQAAITGESMPVDVAAGSHVYAATTAQFGALRIRATAVGRDTTFGRVLALVESAEANRGEMQRFADKFSGYYLPVVAAIALLTLILRRDALAAAAVLVVACSCAFALATPIAMLASIGAGAKRGLLIKGGKSLEALEKIDVLLVDKTGTLTLGRPAVTDVLPLDGLTENELLRLAASAERYSEHPLAQAVRDAARHAGVITAEPEYFTAIPGQGVAATIDGQAVVVGSSRMVAPGSARTLESRLVSEGKTLLWVTRDGKPLGLLAAADTLRDEVPEAFMALRARGFQTIELLTGDNEQTAQTLAARLGIGYRANLLPEDKIRIVKEYQSRGRKVAMVGDGVNDAPALAQADVGIAMAPAGGGTTVAVETAHVVLLREDWRLVPQLFAIARRTMGVVRGNIAFTAIYNLLGLTLAAFGILPPALAAAAQSLPDIGILANASRLIRQQD